ncbi:hypothetical protein LG047_10315 [Methylocystis sp. WRRC1]|uniref:hypothetical protein n=1 Tax=unclassified Methylocystis TaxID=2625913 RepID=UPI0001F87331|nr:MULTISPECIES: hypothetical protein [unclassified Methylocystis]MCC3245715.1 hypothetical protein [Methylocystis sp. WRRC1]
MSEEKRDIEIIPPGEEFRDETSSRIWISTGGGEVKFVRLGPFGSLMVGLGLLLLLALGFFFLSGLFLILVPVAAVLGLGAWFSGLIGGGSNRRLR